MNPSRDEVIHKIKSKGYWEINIHPDPATYKKHRIPEDKIKDLVKASVVRLRGWDYPHFSGTEGGPLNIHNGIEKYIEWEYFIEFWRMTTSGNFYNLVALWEDWRGTGKLSHIFGEDDLLKEKEWLGIIGTLYRITEIFEFTKRLALHNIFEDKLVLDIKLKNIANRRLVADSPQRVPFFSPKIFIGNEWYLESNTFQVDDLLNKSDELALNAFIGLVRLFQWDNPPLENLRDDQQKFLQGRI